MVTALIVILVSLSLAYFLAEVVKKLGLPRVVGQISAGLILGIPLINNFLLTEKTLDILSFLANLGIVLLFYYIGLETNFTAFTKNLRQSVLISLFNTFLPLILGFIVMKFFFDFSTVVSLIIAVSLAVSAQSVSLDILEELKLLKSRLASRIIGAGAVDDIIELILVSIIFSIFHVVISNLTLTKLFLDILLFMTVLIAARLWLVPRALKLFDKEKSTTARFTGSLLIVILIASLAEFLGIGLLIGAMVAGMIVRQTILKDRSIPDWEEHDIARSVHLIAFGFLIPLFFVMVGLNVDLSLFFPELWLILLLFLISVVGTVGGSLIAVLLSKGTFKEGLTLGFGLTPKGDVELVIATLALNSGIITVPIFTALVMMSLLTSIVAPIFFTYLVLKGKSPKGRTA